MTGERLPHEIDRLAECLAQAIQDREQIEMHLSGAQSVASLARQIEHQAREALNQAVKDAVAIAVKRESPTIVDRRRAVNSVAMAIIQRMGLDRLENPMKAKAERLRLKAMEAAIDAEKQKRINEICDQLNKAPGRYSSAAPFHAVDAMTDASKLSVFIGEARMRVNPNWTLTWKRIEADRHQIELFSRHGQPVSGKIAFNGFSYGSANYLADALKSHTGADFSDIVAKLFPTDKTTRTVSEIQADIAREELAEGRLYPSNRGHARARIDL